MVQYSGMGMGFLQLKTCLIILLRKFRTNQGHQRTTRGLSQRIRNKKIRKLTHIVKCMGKLLSKLKQ